LVLTKKLCSGNKALRLKAAGLLAYLLAFGR